LSECSTRELVFLFLLEHLPLFRSALVMTIEI
jgi:hypothetical protein